MGSAMTRPTGAAAAAAVGTCIASATPRTAPRNDLRSSRTEGSSLVTAGAGESMFTTVSIPGGEGGFAAHK